MISRTQPLTILGIILLILGVVVVYYGTARVDKDTVQKMFIFGSYIFHDYATNKTYQGGGDSIFIDLQGCSIEAHTVHPPESFNGSLYNLYFAIWDGGTKANLPGNEPNEIVNLEFSPTYFPNQHLVSFELLADEPMKNLGFYAWTVDFVIARSIPQNTVLIVTGILVLAAGLTTIALMNYKPRKSNELLPPPPLQ